MHTTHTTTTSGLLTAAADGGTSEGGEVFDFTDGVGCARVSSGVRRLWTERVVVLEKAAEGRDVVWVGGLGAGRGRGGVLL
ncbi:hypothetical protein EV426DRAFT_699173 [Tirmania nivea]|nr:hypothetical protein EV426DRAFT_699173 [Tirmania nivea]